MVHSGGIFIVSPCDKPVAHGEVGHPETNFFIGVGILLEINAVVGD